MVTLHTAIVGYRLLIKYLIQLFLLLLAQERVVIVFLTSKQRRHGRLCFPLPDATFVVEDEFAILIKHATIFNQHSSEVKVTIFVQLVTLLGAEYHRAGKVQLLALLDETATFRLETVSHRSTATLTIVNYRLKTPV